MMKRLLTFALSVGFFIWLPNAFADGSGILSLDAPSHIRQTQTPGDDNALLTLRVDNIQVRESWEVTDADNVFTINAGKLQTVTTVVPGKEYVATIYAVDKFDLLNPNYANLTASAVITVKFESGGLELSDAPRLTAVAGKAVSLHIFAAMGGGEDKTYTLVGGNVAEYFSVGVTSGVLSVNAQEGVYVLTVEARDDAGGIAEAVATVEVLAALSLADALSLGGAQMVASELHTFVARGGIGARTYTLLAGNAEGYFSLGAESGVLSLLASATLAIYTLSVRVRDGDGNMADALAVVDVRALYLASPRPLYAIEGRAVSLHTFAAQGDTGAGIYTLVAGDEGYFTLGMNSGVLSVKATTPIGIYTLSVKVEADNNQADTTAIVEVRASLSLVAVPLLTVIAGGVAHTLAASNGIGTHTYAIVSGDEVGFAVDAASGVLSLSVNAELGRHTLTMQVADARKNIAETVATVEVSAALVLEGAPPFTVIASVGMSLHMFIASGGIGILSYAILAGNEKEGFTLNATSGVLSVVNAAAGVYTLSVKVSDSRGNSAQARGTVEVLEVLSLADVSLVALARLSVEVSLTTFAASGGYGAKRYMLIADKFDYFALDAASGELSLPSNSAMLAGAYTLRVEVSDSLMPPQRATAAAAVQIARNGIFVLGGNADNGLKNDVWRSTDGKAWNRETANAGWPGRRDHQAVVHNGRMYVLGGWVTVIANDVWSSADGKNWSFEGDAAWTAREQHQAVSYKGRIYVLGGSDGSKRNDVWSSADGETWRRDKENNAAGWTKRQGHQAVVHNGRMYVLGGNARENNANVRKKDVWSSADGANWRFEGDAEWRAREYHLAVSHQGRLYILGGSWGAPDLSDVWSSLDGKSWRQELANNGSFWSHRYGFGALSRDGRMYVLGGQNGPYLNDVWSSADGKIWKEEAAAAAWRKRQLQAVVLPPNLVLSGTSETIILPLLQGGAGHTVSAQYGGGQYTYSLTPEIAGINIDGAGVLSADNRAQAGAYTLTVRVEDEEGGHAETILNIELRTFALADAPPLFAFARLSVAASLHAFTAAYGDGAYTYDLVNNAGDFIIGEASGVLSVQANAAVGVYTVSVAVSDAGDNRATAVATVRIAKNGIFVMGGEDTNYHNDVWVSAEGRNWIKVADAPWSARTRHQMVVYQGRMYVLGGWEGTSSSDGNSLNDVWSSADGKNWRREADAPWSARNAHQVVAYNGRMYVLGGATGWESDFLNDVWSWAEGESWTEEAAADWSARSEHQAVSHNSRLYVLGGWDNDNAPRNDVWSSVDGENWQREKANNTDNSVNWTRRRSHQAMLHNGRIYVMGGWGYNPTYNGVADQGVLNDVWSSTDVENWDEKKQDTNTSGWFFRNFFQALSHDGQIYVLGGDYRGDRNNEVWRSVEGSTWEKVADADWSVRSAHQAVVFPPNLALSGIGETITLTAGVETEIYTFSAQYGFGQYTYSLAPENIDIKIDGDGVLLMSDQAQTGAYAITVRVEDKERSHAETIINIEIRSFALADAPPLFVFAGLAEAVSLHAFTAVYGVGAYTYTLVGDDAGYFTLGTASGVLSVTANVSVGVYTLSVEVSDERAKTATAVATVAAVPILSLADAPLRSVVAGKAVSLHTFTAVGGSRTKTYNLVDASGYFALGESSGILSVQVVSEVGIYTVSVRVSDESGQAAAVAIVEVVARLSLADASLIAVEKKAVSLHTFAASGGIGARTYTLLAGNETGYFVLDASGGVLSLSASASPGTYVLTVGVKDERGNVATAVAAVNIAASLSLADAPPLVAAEGEARNLHTFVASGGLGVKTYTLVAGAAYFTVGVSSGVLSVDENATVAMYTLSVQAADADGVVAVALATVEVVSLLLFDAPTLYAIPGQEVSLHTFEAGGGSGAKVFTIVDGNEDMYFTLVASSGVLSMQAKALGGIYTLTVAVNDEDGNRAEARAVVVVADLFLADMPLLTAFTEMTLSLHTFAAIGGIGANTYTLAASEGQEYFILNATSGVLSVVNAAVGVYTLSVTVSDSIGNSAQARGTVEVLEVLSLADAPYLEALARLKVEVSLHTFAAGGGIGNKRYTLIADKFDYFAIDADSGVLSLPSNSAMLAGTYTLMVEASDSLTPPQRATAAATVQIARNGIFVLGGNESASSTNDLQNDVWWSVDGETWNLVTGSANWTARELHQVVAHRGRMYLLGGFATENKNDVWSSLDGKNWSLVKGSADWTARSGHQALVHKGRMYVLGGRDDVGHRNDVWSSADGKNWDEETGSADWTLALYQAVAHNGRMYALGGYDKKDVWSSADGSSWRFEGNAAWGLRHLHQAVSHAGRLYVLGGIERVNNSDNRRNDVWSSLDGRIWVEEKANNTDFWAKRDRYQALSRDGFLYVLGGNANGLRKDVWSSPDGKSWDEETAAAGWKAREYHQALVFPPNLVLSGTSETITLTMGVGAELHTFSAQYGVGQYTYSLALESESMGFDINESSGVLSAESDAEVGGYTLTVQVEDEEGSRAETVVQVEIIAASTAALSAGSSIISPSALGGGASALALAGGGLSLLIITPPASSLARPRTPPQARGVRI